MNSFIDKLKFIFVPFLVIAVCVIGGYTFLNWLLFIKWHAFSVRENIPNNWIPLVLPWIPVLIWLRPRLKLLYLKSLKGNPFAFYLFFSAFAIAIPAIFAQSYLETATGKLTELQSINQINQKEATKYYTLNNYYIDKKHIGVKSSINISGKSNAYYNMHLYFALPILASPNDTLSGNCLAWYGIKYSKQISNRLSKEEKDERYADFVDDCQVSFDQRDVSQFIYLDRIGNTDEHQAYIAAIKSNERYSQNSTTVLLPVDEPFEARNGNRLTWTFGALGIASLIFLLMINYPVFDDEALAKLKAGTGKRFSGK